VVKRGTDQIISAIKPNHEFPPTFLVQASDDPVGVENSVELYKALKKAGVPVEMHLYATGGHGFGMRPGKGPTSDWPKRCEEWMQEQKILLPAGED
jgi:acetyl esterase/lipase